jgi:hypothetical protein
LASVWWLRFAYRANVAATTATKDHNNNATTSGNRDVADEAPAAAAGVPAQATTVRANAEFASDPTSTPTVRSVQLREEGFMFKTQFN